MKVGLGCRVLTFLRRRSRLCCGISRRCRSPWLRSLLVGRDPVTNLHHHVRGLRPLLARADPADRLEYVASDQYQCDLWFPPVKILLGDGIFGTPPVLVMVPSFSRFITARMLPSRTTTDLWAGTWELLGDVGGAPHLLLWDDEARIGQRNSLTKPAAFFNGALATRFV